MYLTKMAKGAAAPHQVEVFSSWSNELEIIQFGHPEYLPYMLVALTAAVTASIIWFRRRTVIVRFFGINQGRVYSKKRIFFFLIVFCLITLGTALVLSEPYYAAKKEQDVFEPLLIVIAQDISKSMLAPISSIQNKEGKGLEQDLPCTPTRLQVAEQEVISFVEVLEQQKTDKVALVVFARYAYPAIPVPTGDYLLFKRRFLKETLLENALTMAEGSNHWAGVERALQVFDTKLPYRKIVIIITDGDPEAPPDILAQSKKVALDKLKQAKDVGVYTVGIGELGTALPVPLIWQKNSCPDPEGDYMKQTVGSGENSIMFTRTDPERLQAFANDLSGTYIHAAQGSDLADALKNIVIRERVKTGVKYESVLIDLSEPLLWVLLSLLGVLVFLKTP
jgi:hypothetical protein